MNIQYYDSHTVRNYIESLSGELKKVFNDELSGVRFFPLGESPSSSGGIFLYDFRKDLMLPESAFPYSPFKDIDLSGVKAFVFFDDIIGSGNQAVKFANEHLKEMKIDKYYVAIIAFKDGLKKVEDNACFKKVIVAQLLSEEYKAFSPNSQVFPEQETRRRLEEMCRRYGERLYPKHPLGYDDSQALIVFPHNTPNNTLPIIWASDKNEKEKGVVWNPLWERRKRVLSYETPSPSTHTHVFHYDAELLGRENEEEKIKTFFHDPNCHFFLLYGVGGIGKTHLMAKVYEEMTEKPLWFKCSKLSRLDQLAKVCGIQEIDKIKKEDRRQYFLNKFSQMNTNLIIDDFYEVIDEDLREILPDLTGLSGGKLLIISRAIPKELNITGLSFSKHRLGQLGKEPYFKFLDNIAARRNVQISISDKEKYIKKRVDIL